MPLHLSFSSGTTTTWTQGTVDQWFELSIMSNSAYLSATQLATSSLYTRNAHTLNTTQSEPLQLLIDGGTAYLGVSADGSVAVTTANTTATSRIYLNGGNNAAVLLDNGVVIYQLSAGGNLPPVAIGARMVLRADGTVSAIRGNIGTSVFLAVTAHGGAAATGGNTPINRAPTLASVNSSSTTFFMSVFTVLDTSTTPAATGLPATRGPLALLDSASQAPLCENGSVAWQASARDVWMPVHLVDNDANLLAVENLATHPGPYIVQLQPPFMQRACVWGRTSAPASPLIALQDIAPADVDMANANDHNMWTIEWGAGAAPAGFNIPQTLLTGDIIACNIKPGAWPGVWRGSNIYPSSAVGGAGGGTPVYAAISLLGERSMTIGTTPIPLPSLPSAPKLPLTTETMLQQLEAIWSWESHNPFDQASDYGNVVRAPVESLGVTSIQTVGEDVYTTTMSTGAVPQCNSGASSSTPCHQGTCGGAATTTTLPYTMMATERFVIATDIPGEGGAMSRKPVPTYAEVLPWLDSLVVRGMAQKYTGWGPAENGPSVAYTYTWSPRTFEALSRMASPTHVLAVTVTQHINKIDGGTMNAVRWTRRDPQNNMSPNAVMLYQCSSSARAMRPAMPSDGVILCTTINDIANNAVTGTQMLSPNVMLIANGPSLSFVDVSAFKPTPMVTFHALHPVAVETTGWMDVYGAQLSASATARTASTSYLPMPDVFAPASPDQGIVLTSGTWPNPNADLCGDASVDCASADSAGTVQVCFFTTFAGAGASVGSAGMPDERQPLRMTPPSCDGSTDLGWFAAATDAWTPMLVTTTDGGSHWLVKDLPAAGTAFGMYSVASGCFLGKRDWPNDYLATSGVTPLDAEYQWAYSLLDGMTQARLMARLLANEVVVVQPLVDGNFLTMPSASLISADASDSNPLVFMAMSLNGRMSLNGVGTAMAPHFLCNPNLARCEPVQMVTYPSNPAFNCTVGSSCYNSYCDPHQVCASMLSCVKLAKTVAGSASQLSAMRAACWMKWYPIAQSIGVNCSSSACLDPDNDEEEITTLLDRLIPSLAGMIAMTVLLGAFGVGEVGDAATLAEMSDAMADATGGADALETTVDEGIDGVDEDVDDEGKSEPKKDTKLTKKQIKREWARIKAGRAFQEASELAKIRRAARVQWFEKMEGAAWPDAATLVAKTTEPLLNIMQSSASLDTLQTTVDETLEELQIAIGEDTPDAAQQTQLNDLTKLSDMIPKMQKTLSQIRASLVGPGAGGADLSAAAARAQEEVLQAINDMRSAGWFT